jgi:hypothetical protein
MVLQQIRRTIFAAWQHAALGRALAVVDVDRLHDRQTPLGCEVISERSKAALVAASDACSPADGQFLDPAAKGLGPVPQTVSKSSPEPLSHPRAKTWLAFGSALASPFGGRLSRFRIGELTLCRIL